MNSIRRRRRRNRKPALPERTPQQVQPTGTVHKSPTRATCLHLTVQAEEQEEITRRHTLLLQMAFRYIYLPQQPSPSRLPGIGPGIKVRIQVGLIPRVAEKVSLDPLACSVLEGAGQSRPSLQVNGTRPRLCTTNRSYNKFIVHNPLILTPAPDPNKLGGIGIPSP